ncbi:MAG: phosphate ABC transporter permease subunit PstC [Chloroflexi bacterium]|nr:phosphate ABC transporter permease subunit PstC [Chloroflexota bacterium]
MTVSPNSNNFPAGLYATAAGRSSLRSLRDRAAGSVFLAATLLPVGLVIVMIIGLTLRAQPILVKYPIGDLLTGETWKPLQGQFGFAPFIVGTVWVTIVAMIIAVPVCVLTAIYLSEYAGPHVRNVMKPLLDLLAGIPSVIYGIWGVITIVPLINDVIKPVLSQTLGFLPLFQTDNPTGFSVLAGSMVLGLMVTPVITSVAYEVMQTVPQGLREASLAVGATQWQTVKFAVLRKSAPGLIAGVMLGFSRAFGETIAVLMVVGNVPQMPHSIFDAAYPLPALIANNYGEMMSIPMYDAALMGAALVLLVLVVAFNLLATLALRQAVRRAA